MDRRDLFSYTMMAVGILGLLLTIYYMVPGVSAAQIQKEEGAPDLDIIAEAAKDGVVLGIGIKNPDLGSDNFIHVNNYDGVIHTNELWVFLYTPPSMRGKDITINAEFWEEREVKEVQGNVTTTVIKKFHQHSKNYTFPYAPQPRLLRLDLPRHTNLTKVRMTYKDLEFRFDHLSSPAGEPLKAKITTKGELFEQVAQVLGAALLVAMASMLLGKKIYQRVKYVPKVGILDLLPVALILGPFIAISWDQIEFWLLHGDWWLILIPWAAFTTFYSLQLYNPMVLRTMLLKVYPTSKDQVAPDFETRMVMIVKEKDHEYLVEPTSWKHVIYRLFSKGPVVEYETAGNSNIVPIRDENPAIDQIFLVNKDKPVLIQWPSLVWRPWIKLGPIEIPRPAIDPGMCLIPLAPLHFESMRLQVMSQVLSADEAIAKADEERQQYNRLQARILRSREESETDTAEAMFDELFNKRLKPAGVDEHGSE